MAGVDEAERRGAAESGDDGVGDAVHALGGRSDALDVRYPAAFDAVLQAEGIEVVQTGVRMPRMNAVMERWVRS
ncbi:hypothetical protein N4G69_54445, partial [Streptomyces mirabilis]|nr:hypothetical protein [Streptomyces mirabilis]